MDQTSRPKAQAATLTIRFLAAAYDGLILFGVTMVMVGIPLTISETSFAATPPDWLRNMLFMTVCYAYFVGLWVKGGTTTGMRPWKLRVAMRDTGLPLSLATASVRFAVLMLTWLGLVMTLIYLSGRYTHHPIYFLAASIPPISLLCILFSRSRQPLHDLVSGTGVFRVAE